MKKNFLKTQSQIDNIKESWKYLTELLQIIYAKIKPWISLIELEEIAESFIQENDLKWAFKWYMWYPANLCLSINDCVVHWIPDNYVLKEWDLLKVDCWIIYKKWVTDSAFSVVVWWSKYDKLSSDLIKTTKQALDTSINFLKNDSYFYNFSKSIQNTVENKWFKVIKNLTWHWVGTKVHEKPHIFNWAHPETKKIKILKNMVLAIEPITCIKSDSVINKDWNKWNLYTLYWDKWAQREYTVVITDNWPEVVSWIQ